MSGRLTTCLAGLLLLGCTGQVEPGPRRGGHDGAADTEPGQPALDTAPTEARVADTEPEDTEVTAGERGLCEGAEPTMSRMPRMLRRLTADAYRRSVADALGLAGFTPTLPVDPAAPGGLRNNAALLTAGPAFTAAIADAAADAAARFTAADHLLPALPCAAAPGVACLRSFLSRHGRRLLRRPLTDAEQARYVDLFEVAGGQDDFPTGLRWVLTAMLQSPHLLYRSELGHPVHAGATGDGGAGEAQLDDYEVATALAYGLHGSGPSDALLDATRDGELGSPAGRAAAATGMLTGDDGLPSARLRAVLGDFVSAWLDLPALGAIGKEEAAFTAEVREAMGRELRDFVAHVLWTPGGGVRQLLTSETTVLGPVLSAYYGYGNATEEGTPVRRPAQWGVGLLAQGAVLALGASNRHSSPTQRGHLVRTRLLCDEIPPAPGGVDVFPDNDAVTTRQRHQALVDHAYCGNCHALMDNIGFGFEHFDEVGRFRATEAGQVIEASGLLVATATADAVNFDGPVGTAQALAGLTQTTECVGAYLAGHATGLSERDSACQFDDLTGRLVAGEIGLLDYYVGVVSGAHFDRRGN